MKLRPYPIYKRFRVAGIDSAVPAHWKVVQLGRLGEFFKGVGGPRSDNTTAGRPCIRYGDIYTKYQYHIRNPMAFVSESASSRYTPIRYGDVLFAGSGETLDDIGKSVANLLQKACAGGDVIVLRPSALVDPVYFGYAMESAPIRYQKACAGRGVTVMHVYASELKNVCVTLPGFDEQRIIATFLDHHTAKIDALIDKARHLIEGLQEKRRSLITEIVTRGLPPNENRKAGLDPFPKLRPSGVEWLGDVPEHWMVQRMKQVATCTDDGRTSGVVDSRSTTSWFLGMDAVESRTGRMADSARLPLTAGATSQRSFRKGDVLFGKLRPYLAKSCRPDFDGLCSGEFLVLDGNEGELDNCYLLYLALSQYVVASADASAYGTKMPRTNWQEVGAVLVPVPPIREQRAICCFLNAAMTKIDRLVRHAQLLIERLREKRQALITAAVTGQIDVREEGRGATV